MLRRAASILLCLAGLTYGIPLRSKLHILSSWPGSFKGDVRLNVDRDLNCGWKIFIIFNKPVKIVHVWNADVVANQGNRKYSMKNKHYNFQKKVGDVISVGFIGKTQGNPPTGIVTLFDGTFSYCRLHTELPKQKPTTSATIETTAWPPKFDYDEVIRKSILFYEAQRSGKLPILNRVPWRGDSCLEDKGHKGEDLSGGWYDAGDFVKFNFPMASATTLLTWSIIEYGDAYRAAGQLDHALDSIKWPLDYFVKCHTATNELYGQIGNGDLDHAYWGRPEQMTMRRPAYKLNASLPGSDLAGETAAAMAAGHIAFQIKDPAYASLLLEHAEAIFEFADKYRGKYSDSIPDADKFYRSYTGYMDELSWAAAWLFRATSKTTYLKKAKAYVPTDTSWAFSWDDKTAGAQILLYGLTGNRIYGNLVEKYLNQWLRGGSVTYTPRGLAHRIQWGANRYAANTAFLALVAADKGLQNKMVYRNFARKQIHYMLGDSGRSFVVGFGRNPPQRPHHASSSCPNRPAPCSWKNYFSDDPNPQILYGALVGGPDQQDNFRDDRQNYISNEVACDYNAGFQGAVAALRSLSL